MTDEDLSGASEKNTVAKCYCSGCGKFFASTHNFDKHRTGMSNRIVAEDTRRCMTTEEMQQHGFVSERRIVRDRLNNIPRNTEQDVWFDSVARQEAREAFAKLKDH